MRTKFLKHLSPICLLPLVLSPTLYNYDSQPSVTSLKQSDSSITPNNGQFSGQASIIGTQPTSLEQLKGMTMDQILKFNTFDARALGTVTSVKNQQNLQLC